MRIKGIMVSLHCNNSKDNTISRNLYRRVLLFIFIIAVSINEAALAEHVDVAPVSNEVIDNIVSNYAYNDSDPIPAIFQQHVSQTIKLLSVIEASDNRDIAASKSQLLSGIIHGFETLQKDIVNNVYSIKGDNYKRLLIERFGRAINALNSVLKKPDKKNIKKAKKIFFKIKSGEPITKPGGIKAKVDANGKFYTFTGIKKPSSRREPPITNSKPNFRRDTPNRYKRKI